ncbi:unnamed protein product [Strongylus vulgaris]|uniref:Uncharacterized protein n=1 Tax=Strongylus vulgaris TaxID=40348 RepID=A0A3P7LP50_STRVU|nr:unnamed protein product [Strongylus vulgaris]
MEDAALTSKCTEASKRITAKRLAAFGCKVFQVKELLHGRTLRKVNKSRNVAYVFAYNLSHDSQL